MLILSRRFHNSGTQLNVSYLQLKQLNKKDKKEQLSDEEIDELCKTFLNDMEHAADVDVETLNNKSGVALEKLKMLARVTKVLSNKMFHESLLELNVLKVCRYIRTLLRCGEFFAEHCCSHGAGLILLSTHIHRCAKSGWCIPIESSLHPTSESKLSVCWLNYRYKPTRLKELAVMETGSV